MSWKQDVQRLKSLFCELCIKHLYKFNEMYDYLIRNNNKIIMRQN